jgi:hypothetical protein
MASRAGQKGTLGLIIPEEDMPFTADGIRPDIIINPHAIPSRMTIGQIVESLFGKVCTSYGAFGDCTAFQVKGSNYSTYAPLLVKAGFNCTGNQILYNGMTGEQIQSDIYIGPTYYMRLKHMVKDKINYRATGPRTNLTRQTVQGRANDGGLRIGEMERDGVLAHGMSSFLNESFMVRGDEYYMAICNKTGAIAIYNEVKNLFLSPFADGPINFHTNPDGTMNVKNISKFGRSFSLLRIPYSFKLLIQELQTMNIQMRIITDENVDQLLSLSYSNNIGKLLKTTDITSSQDENLALKINITNLKTEIKNALTKPENKLTTNMGNDSNEEDNMNEPNDVDNQNNQQDNQQDNSAENNDGLPYIPINIKPPSNETNDTVPYAPGSPAYEPNTTSSFEQEYSSPYEPGSSPILIKRKMGNEGVVVNEPTSPNIQQGSLTSSESPLPTPQSILEVEEVKENTEANNENNGENNAENNNEKKIIVTSESNNETKKINI